MFPSPRQHLRAFSLLASLTVAACSDDDSTPTTINDAAAASDAGAADAASSTSGGTRISVDQGELQGKLVGTTRQFLGVPYAKPPVGELRWQPPQPADKWTTPRDATQFGKRCAQLASGVLMNGASSDEDCLYLNVWTPAAPTSAALPVMLWIHGGGNVNGSASEPVPYVNTGLFYDGTKLSEKGVVVVSFNYRLGVFGFFDHEGLGAEGGGNQGLLDQQAALVWVSKNIAKFGGDASNVTIFGESAGSFDVCAHVASPKSRGLFHRAISQSGGCTTRVATKAEARTASSQVATQLGCSGSGELALACLRSKPVDALLGSVPQTTTGSAFGPIVDGAFLTEQPRASFDRGEIAKVPYILGSNTDEGTLFLTSSKVADQATYETALSNSFGAQRVADILALYPASKFEGQKPNAFHAALARALGDARLVCPTHDSAIRATAAGLPVYAYNYDIPAPIGDLGATHGAELTSVFGTSPNFSAEAKAASERLQRYWTQFAKAGDPNGGSDLAWPKLTETSDVRLNFALTPTLVSDFRAAECAFWRAAYDRQFATP